jgi:soluble lytic murein transglycosylase-like protein
MGLIKTESEFNPNVISETNDYGLMQINKINHKWLSEELGITDFLDPYQNVRAGIYILKDLFDEYEDTSKVLMAYNMGETGAKRLWVRGIYESKYSKEIINNAKDFKNGG